MSKILNQLKSAAEGGNRCHVQVSDSMTYGPVTLETVCQWAAQGRVTSDSQISFNRRDWAKADSIPELGLDWVAVSDTVDDYGPFNMQALSQLVRRGIVSPDAQLKHRETGETLGVSEALERAMGSRPFDAAAARLLGSMGPDESGLPQSAVSHAISLSHARKAGQSDEALPAQPDDPIAEIRQELAVAREELARLQLESEGGARLKEEVTSARESLTAMRVRYEALQEESDSREIEQGGRIAELEELRTVAREGRMKAETELESAVAEHMALQISLEDRVAELTARVASLVQEAQQTSERNTVLESDLAETRMALNEAQEEITLRIGTHEADQKVAAKEIAALKTTLAAARKLTEERGTEATAATEALTRELKETRDRAVQLEVENGGTADALREEVAQRDERLAAAEAEQKEQLSAYAALQSELEVAQQQLADKDKQLAAQATVSQDRASQLVAQAGKLEEQDEVLADKTRELKELGAELEERDAKLSKAEALAHRLEARIEKLDATFSTQGEVLASTQAELQATSAAFADAKVAAAKDAKARAVTMAQLADIRSAHEAKVLAHVDLSAKTQSDAQRFEARIAELEQTVVQKDADIVAAQAEAKGAADTLADVRKGMKKDAKASASAIAQMKATLENQSKRVSELEQAKAEQAKPLPLPEPPKDWYLRYGPDSVLGPVSFDVLVGWVRDCRVAPDHDVSSDKIFWSRAVDMAGLEMDWMVTLVDETVYGPINKFAVNDLIADGAVAEDATLTHRKTGETLSAKAIKRA